jgi:methylated-DNA-[protein]-cysteine S-methyltransferase
LWTKHGLIASSIENSYNSVLSDFKSSFPDSYFYYINSTSPLRKHIYNYFNKLPFNTDFIIDYSYTTLWQKEVYKQVINIPYGHTASYKDISLSLKKLNSYRAVGSALKNNKLFLIIPCHRVILNNGNIGGFSRGLPLKKYLLKLENVIF